MVTQYRHRCFSVSRIENNHGHGAEISDGGEKGHREQSYRPCIRAVQRYRCNVVGHPLSACLQEQNHVTGLIDTNEIYNKIETHVIVNNSGRINEQIKRRQLIYKTRRSCLRGKLKMTCS